MPMNYWDKRKEEITRCAIIAALAAVAYAILGHLWLAAAHWEMEAHAGRIVLDGPVFTALKIGFVFVVLAAGASSSWWYRGHWAMATVLTTLGGILGGFALYRVAERLWWPEFIFWCVPHVIAGRSVDHVCLGPFPFAAFDVLERYIIYAAMVLGLVGSALLAGWAGKESASRWRPAGQQGFGRLS